MKVFIEELDLPDEVIDFLVEHDKIEQLYPPQAEAVKKGLFEGKNLLVCIPTASGKTLIGELAILKCVLEQRKKAIYLAPLRALAAEKYQDFKRFEKLGVTVTITSGDYDSKDAWLDRYDVIISTNEKMDALMRHGIEWLDQVGLLVVDEAHLLGERDRGPILEVLLTKFRLQNPEAQILCLSATIRNTRLLARWLDAELVESDWRPVILKEGVVYDHVILYEDESREIISKAYGEPLVDLIVHSLNEGGQILVFCNTRKTSLTTAKKIADVIHDRFVKRSPKKEHLKAVVSEIRSHLGVASIEVEELCELIIRGVAYHNAGLSSFLRHVIEREFRAGNILVLTATPTLSAGINLPARRVVITSLWRYQDGQMHSIPVMEYKQMAGRAGRPRYDPYGTALIMAANAKQADKFFYKYVHGEVEELRSRLNAEPALRKTMLSLISSEIVLDYEGLKRFMELTFWGYTTITEGYEVEMLERSLGRVLDFFENNRFIGFDVAEEVFLPVELGKRVSTLYLDPLSASMIIKGLRKAVTLDLDPSPLSYLMLVSITPDMISLHARNREQGDLEKLTNTHEDAFLLLDSVPERYSLFWEQFLGFFKTTIVLQQWIDEHPPYVITAESEIGMGDLNRIVEAATWLIHASKEIALTLRKEEDGEKWNELINDLDVLELRVQFGVKEDLLELIKVKGIGRVRARLLYKNGIKSIKELATIDLNAISKLPGFGLALAEKIQTEARKMVNVSLEADEVIEMQHEPELDDLVKAESLVESLIIDELPLEVIGTTLSSSQDSEEFLIFKKRVRSKRKRELRSQKSKKTRKRRDQQVAWDQSVSNSQDAEKDDFVSAAELLKTERKRESKKKNDEKKEQSSLDDFF